MARSILRFQRIDFDFNEIGDLIGDAVGNGVFGPATTDQIVLEGDDGGRIVFKGDFNVSNGVITGGKVTGYTASLGGDTLMKAKALDFTFAELDQAVKEAQSDTGSSEGVYFLLLTVDRTVGSNADDVMFGISPLLLGRKGDDTIISMFGDKTIRGDDGDDLIIAGTGDDDLYGGRGRDTFAFTSPEDGVDRLNDFKSRHEQIGLDDGGFAALGAAVDAAEIALGKEALTGDHHLLYDRNSGKLWWDVDGVGGSAKVLLAHLPDGTKLGAANFFIDDFT